MLEVFYFFLLNQKLLSITDLLARTRDLLFHWKKLNILAVNVLIPA